MSRQVIIQELAQQELLEAALWYKEHDKKVAHALIAEVRHLAERIRLFPLMFAEIEPDIRRCPLKNFPFSLLYEIEGERIIIFAVMHQHRKPDYWQDRIR
jgi:plasmid stabilization system protein ParE